LLKQGKHVGQVMQFILTSLFLKSSLKKINTWVIHIS